MIKIFLYECKRLILNKFFFGILFVLLFYGWQVLSNATILGVSHTAPFSAWSFGDYLCRMLPLLWIGALFFLTFFTSAKARRAAVLTDATQTDTLRRSSYGNRTAGARLPRGSSRILRQIFWMVRMGAAACTCFGHTDPCTGICFRQRLAAGKNQTVAGICLDDSTVCVYDTSFAGGAGAMEWKLFRQLSSDAWNIGSCFLFACISCFGSMCYTDMRHTVAGLPYGN